MGYHVKALLKQSKRIKVVVLEPKLSILKCALEYLDFSTELEEGQLQILYGRQLLKRINKYVQRRSAADTSTVLRNYVRMCRKASLGKLFC